jgi:hypothetical protein
MLELIHPGVSSLELWQECHAAVMQRHPVEPHGGYLVLQADTLINPCVIADLNLGDMWYAPALAFIAILN